MTTIISDADGQVLEELDDQPPSPESSRRPDVDGIGFTLADGRVWDLATPRIYFRPTLVEGSGKPGEPAKVAGLEDRRDYPKPARSRVAALLGAYQSGAETFPRVLILDAAASLLALCHDLPPGVLADLLDLTGEESESLAVDLIRMFRAFDLAGLHEGPHHAFKEV